MKNGSMKQTSKFWIDKLNLMPHPEDGYFAEIYKLDIIIKHSNLPEGFSGSCPLLTSIYYLLSGKDISHFHRLKSDKLWCFYAGTPLLLYVIDETGALNKYILGNSSEKNILPFLLITKNLWFAAEVKDKKGYTLAGCTVSPSI
jgi:predicted cupin superfamily sugar epimerase